MRRGGVVWKEEEKQDDEGHYDNRVRTLPFWDIEQALTDFLDPSEAGKNVSRDILELDILASRNFLRFNDVRVWRASHWERMSWLRGISYDITTFKYSEHFIGAEYADLAYSPTI